VTIQLNINPRFFLCSLFFFYGGCGATKNKKYIIYT
jgi:hypothetical protein